jgi:predicted transposase YbfD/YdcC
VSEIRNKAASVAARLNERLKYVTNNQRFLILPGVSIKNLASRTLALNIKRISADWEDVYDHPIIMVETFVDHSRFKGLHGEKPRRDVQFYITSLSAEEADAQALLESIRGQWSIENSLHWVRDVTFDEDRSQIRAGSEPRVFASIRNLAISLLHLHGFKDIASSLRQLGWNRELALSLIGV